MKLNAGWAISIVLVMLIVSTVQSALAAAPVPPSGLTPAIKALVATGQATIKQQSLMVDVSGAGGALLAGWRAFIQRHYLAYGWNLAGGPFKGAAGRWYVILTRISVVGRVVPIVPSAAVKQWTQRCSQSTPWNCKQD